MSESVRQLGVLQPIAVRYVREADRYRIISGERRYRAAVVAGLGEIPCWVQSPEDRQVLVRQITENWQRADLHPFEIADSLARLRDQRGYSQQEIARLLGKSKGEVSKFLSLLTLAPTIQAECRQESTGALSRKHLEALARLPDAQQAQAYAQVKERRLTGRETERLVSRTLARQAGPGRGGGAAGTVFRYGTAKATVTVQFRRAQVTADDQLEALDSARRQVLRVAELARGRQEGMEPASAAS
jgi:ParB family chromosome partitioning protein